MSKVIFLLILLPIRFARPQSNTSTVLSEIMFYPKESNSEFIEIYNTSENNSIDLNGYKIEYQTSKADTIKSAGFGTVLNPKSFAVIFEGDYDFSNGIYKNLIPQNALILKINDNAFGSTGMANTSDRTISLINSVDDTIQTYTYSANNNAGFSDEKVLLNNDNSETNWENSNKLNGTPGFVNSVSPLNFDLEINSFTFSPSIPLENSNLNLKIKIKNNGTSQALNYSVNIYNDLNSDSIGNSSELLFHQDFSSLNVNDSNEVNFTLDSAKAGTYNFISEIQFNDDENLSNNKSFLKVKVFPPSNNFNDLVLNEVMYSPKNGEPEWVELYNRSKRKINLNSWTFSDARTTTLITNNDILIEPNSYIVLSKDSLINNFYSIPSKVIVFNIPSLNNSGDEIVIKDSLGILIDSLEYFPEWGGSDGKSLERISTENLTNEKDNWGTSKSINNATPGKINSITKKDFDAELTQIIFSPAFPILGDNVSVSAKVKNIGKNPAEFFINLFEDVNLDSIPDKFLAKSNNVNLSADDSIIINLNYTIQNLQTEKGFYASIIFNEDQDTTNNNFYKKIKPGFPASTVLINEVMYDPDSDEPEWIELVNTSDKKINLKDWKVSDLLPDTSKKIISSNDLFLSPNEFLIIAHDSSFYNFYPEVNSKIIITNFGTLGNTEDGVIIYDFRNSVIDSLNYKSSWGGKNGFSLERISLLKTTNDSTNWSTSISKNKSTPGKENSIINVSSYKKNDLVINEIMFDPGKDNSEFIEFYNAASDSINIGGWKIEDENENSYELSKTNFWLNKNSYFVLAADSLIISKYNLSNSSKSKLNIINSGTLSLSNSGGLILLKDLKGNTIDSVFYSENWHNKNFTDTKNISLEKINPFLDGNDAANWSSSAANIGATPGKQNSIFAVNKNSVSNISVSPNPFSPDNDGFEDFTIINYKLSQPTSQIKIKIFDSHGRLVRNLSNNKESGSKGSIIFDGLDDSGNPLRMGIYIILLEALNNNSGTTETLKTVVVIARKL